MIFAPCLMGFLRHLNSATNSDDRLVNVRILCSTNQEIPTGCIILLGYWLDLYRKMATEATDLCAIQMTHLHPSKIIYED